MTLPAGPQHPPRAFGRDLALAAAGQLAVLALLAASVGLGPVGWAAGLAVLVGAGLLLTAAGRRGRGAVGPGMRVTLARGTLVGGVSSLVADGLAGGGLRDPRLTVLVAVATLALLMDLADGWLARRSGTVSALGARFDMELDAFLIAVLAVLVATSLGPWVLLIGLARYAFVLAALVLPWLDAPLPPSRARKVVAAVQGGVLVGAAAPIVPRPVATVACALALAALVWSFGRDVRWLARQR